MRKHFSFAFVPFFSFATQLFSSPVSGYVIKDPLTRSAPTELRLLQATFQKTNHTSHK